MDQQNRGRPKIGRNHEEYDGCESTPATTVPNGQTEALTAARGVETVNNRYKRPAADKERIGEA